MSARKQIIAVLAIAAIAIVVFLGVRGTAPEGSPDGQPSPHAIDQSQ